MKTAGVVLDFYDDPNGSLLKKAFPTPEELPESVKVAHVLSNEEREVLRNEAYALILHNEGSMLRKFACVDEGNTLLSCLYFEENAELLPPEAVKTAAANLASFCQDFGLEPTPFIKMAAEMKKDEAAKSGMGKTRDPMHQPMVGDEADWSARTNLTSVRGGADSGRVIPAANQMKTAGLLNVYVVRPSDVPSPGVSVDSHHKLNPESKPHEPKSQHKKKTANMMPGMPGGTSPAPSTMPAAGSPMMGKKPVGGGTAPMAMPKMGSADPLARAVGVDQKNPPQQNLKKHVDQNAFSTANGHGDLEVNAKQVAWPKVANIVDVSGQSPVVYHTKKTASVYALGDKYPLDSYNDVKAAVQYFENNWTDMAPEDRHEYCVKTAARADQLGMEISALMERYGSESYSPDVEAHLSARKANVDKEFHELFDTLKEKRSSIDPEVFAELLAEADRAANLHWHWGGPIADPYLSTFGPSHEKLANADWTWQSRVGDHVNCDQIHKLARDGKGLLKKYFGHDMVEGFMKDPIPVFESLPDDTKTIIARLANGEFDGMPTN